MQATVETISTLERRITVAVPMQPIDEEVAQRIGKLARTVKLAGFRPGKVPLKLVQQQYGASVRQEVIASAVERTFGDAVEQNKLRVAGYPSIEPKSAQAADTLEYIATFEVYPEFEIGDLSGITVERPSTKLADADIDKTVEVLRKQRVTYSPVKRGAKKGDKVSISFHASLDGKEVEATGDQSLDMVLGEEGRIADFDDNLLGGKAGTTKSFEISYPQDFANADVAGKTVHYDVTINTVAEPKLPEVDAEFAKALGVADGDVAKMREEIKDSLDQEVTKRIRTKVKEQVFQALVDTVEIELPKALLAVESQRLMQTAQNNLRSRGVDLANVVLAPEHFDDQAKRNVKLRLIMTEVVSKNALQPTPEQIRAMVDEFAKSFEDPAEVVQWYYADAQRLNEPAAFAMEENVVAWVLERAKVKDKKTGFDELMGNA